MIPMRLDRYLSTATDLSRRAIRRAWRAGRIEVRGPCPVDALHALIFADDEVRLDAEVVVPTPPQHYFVFHKPAGILTAARDPYGRPCLAPWLEDLPGSIFPVGRLDRDTTGLLLLIDDGSLTTRLLEPGRHVAKEYHLRLDGRLDPEDPALALLGGEMELQDGVAIAEQVRISSGTSAWTNVRLVIREGRNRQVRRMARRAHLELLHLHRTRIGPVRLGPVPPGGSRRLERPEVDGLWEVAGGRETARREQLTNLRRRSSEGRLDACSHRRLRQWLQQQDG